MGSLNQATTGLTQSVVPAAIVVLGGYAASVATDFAKENVYDVPIKGGDALYPAVAAVLLNVFLGGQMARHLTIGMTAASLAEVADAYGLV